MKETAIGSLYVITLGLFVLMVFIPIAATCQVVDPISRVEFERRIAERDAAIRDLDTKVVKGMTDIASIQTSVAFSTLMITELRNDMKSLSNFIWLSTLTGFLSGGSVGAVGYRILRKKNGV